MKRLSLLLALVCLLPGVARADGQDPPRHHHEPAICDSMRSDASGHSTSLQCVAGRVVDVSADTLDIRNFHGTVVKVSLTPDTLFQTDSAAGSIEGIASGDFACVAVASHSEGLVAIRVFFDLRMFPCGPWGRHHHHHSVPQRSFENAVAEPFGPPPSDRA